MSEEYSNTILIQAVQLDKKLAVIGKFSGTVRAFLNQNMFERLVTLRSPMRSLRFIIIILFSALTLIIVVTREPTCASAFLPQQPAISGGRTLTPAGVSAPQIRLATRIFDGQTLRHTRRSSAKFTRQTATPWLGFKTVRCVRRVLP